MRHALLAVAVALVLSPMASCGSPPARPARLPGPGPSVVFGPAHAPDGGQIVVGVLVAPSASERLVDLLGEEKLAAFRAAEAQRDGGDDAPGPASEPEEVRPDDVVDFWEVPEPEERTRYGVARAIRERTRVRVVFRDLLAHEVRDEPLVITHSQDLAPSEIPYLEAHVARGGRLLRDRFEVEDVGRARPGLWPDADDCVHGPLVDAIVDAIRTAPLVARLARDPLEVIESESQGDAVRVRLRGRPVRASLRTFEDEVLASIEPDSDGVLNFRFPAADLDPFFHRLVVTWRGLGLELTRAHRLVDLVGATERRVYAAQACDAGSTHAPRVLFLHSRTGAPVAGCEETVRLVRGERTLAEATGRSGSEGSLDLRLRVPADAEPGPARLHVGKDSFYVRIRTSARVSVVTDRGVYRPNDVVCARVMVRDASLGRPMADREVVLSLLGTEKRVRTSAHGIASARFDLHDARLGATSLRARCGRARAASKLQVRAFELPSFKVELEPSELCLRSGEAAPVALTARYVHGAPMAGAEVRAWAPDGFRVPAAVGATDGQGRFALSVEATPEAESGPVRIVVKDADGRTVEKIVAVEVRREADLASTLPPEPVERRPGRVRLTPTRRVLRVGDVLEIRLDGPDGPAWVDIERANAVVCGLSATLRDGRAELSLPLTPDLAGLLVLRALRLENDVPVGCQTRVLVLRGRALDVETTCDRETYRPGQTARLDVRIRDARGEPTAAVLGYWGADEALAAIAPMPDGHEDLFDLVPARSRRDPELLRVARAVERRESREPDPLPRLLSETHDVDRSPYPIRHRSGPGAERDYREKVVRMARRGLDHVRERFVAAATRVPLEQLRTADELREVLLFLVGGGWLDASDLRDPWGGSFAFGQGLGHWREPSSEWSWWLRYGTLVRSAGPDRMHGTRDDAFLIWNPHPAWEFPGRLGRFLRWLEEEGLEDQMISDAPFMGPANNGLIGLGGGAGGAFGGRGGSRDLGAGGGGRKGAAKARDIPEVPVRKDFAPTLCFVPEAIVGPEGSTRLEVPLKDSITTWRMRLVASAADGATGVGTSLLRVSQPLHIDPWIAPHLTVGDELDLPVALHDETDVAMDVELSLEVSDHLTSVGESRVKIRVEPGRTAAHTFRLRATRRGGASVRIEARSPGHADIVERVVRVRPDGREVTDVVSATLDAERPWRAALPELAAGASQPEHRVRVYPTPLSETLAGFEGLVRMPHGCFEQTSSTTYPMVLALDFMRRTDQVHPELAAQAAEYVDSGYRLLRRYEVKSEPGGFSLWGRAPARLFLSAYGLHEFTDMRRVYEVDADLLVRITAYLLGRQQEDGSWKSEREAEPADPVVTRRMRYPQTAYVAWALARAGKPSISAATWLAENQGIIEDPYALALATLALQATEGSGPAARDLADRLAQAMTADARGTLWRADGRTLVGGRGRSADVEATALVVQALLADGRHPDLAYRGLERLVKWRDGHGRFGTTQSTVVALQALLAAAPSGARTRDVRVRGGRDGETDESAGSIFAVSLPPEATEPRDVPLAGGFPAAPFTVAMLGEGQIRMAISRSAWVPWEESVASTGPLALEVRYPERMLPVGRPAAATVRIRNGARRRAENVTIEVGLPPGCTVRSKDVTGDPAERVERGETAIVIYLGHLEAEAERAFEVPFTPRYGLNVRTTPSKAYEYYVPEEASEAPSRRVRAEDPPASR